MRLHYFAVLLTVLNLAILMLILTHFYPAEAQGRAQEGVGVLRGRGLEIVDNRGRVRASITLQPPVVMNGKNYQETILFRLISPEGKPMVKIGAAADGSGMSLIDAADQGVLVHAYESGSYIKITNRGKERVLQP
jgi:hypothetical protein